MSKRLKMDYFRVQMPTALKFEQGLESISKLSSKDRNLTIGQPVRLHSMSVENGIVHGEFTKIRMDDLPAKASLEGEIADLELEDDEGIGEQSAFLYEPQMRVLILQANRAISSKTVSIYVTEKCRLTAPIQLDPILTSDAVIRLSTLKKINKFSVRVAKVDNAEIFKNEGHSLEGLTKILQEFSAPRLTFEVSTGRGNATLAVAKVKSAAAALLGLIDEDNDISRVEISGRTDEDEQDTIDLVTEKMSDVDWIEAGERGRIQYALRKAALDTAFTRRRSELSKMFAVGKADEK